MFGSKRGDSPIPLIFFTVLFLLTGAATYNEYNQMVLAKERLEQKEADKMPVGLTIPILRDQESELQKQINGISNILGFGYKIGGNELSVNNVKETLNAFKTEKDESERIKYPLLHGKAEFVEEDEVPVTLTLNVSLLMEALIARHKKLEEENKILQSDIEKSQRYLDDENSQKSERVRDLEERIQKLNEEVDEINNKKKEQKDQLESLTQESQNVAEEVKTETADVKKKNKKDLAKYNSILASLRQEIRFLIKQRKTGKKPDIVFSGKVTKAFKLTYENPDGEIVDSDPVNRVTYINIGSRHNVVKGLKFDVFRYGEEHKIRLKGKVEVTRVEEDMSRVQLVTEVNSYDPILRGDFIINPLWDRRFPKYVAFSGEVFGSRHKQADLLRFCEDIGVIVELDENGRSKVTAKTNILVAGELQTTASSFKKEAKEDDESEEGEESASKTEEKGEFWWLEEENNFKKALEMGVEIMSADEFLKYIGD